MIGMGSVVLNNINNDSVAYGNPCREVSKRWKFLLLLKRE
jgi:acetyltransferase-like isoleucine patch superfamily enzyme